MIIKTKSFPRAGLVGNPSDGYFGKTIAFTFDNFSADVTLYQTPELEILSSERDHSVFNSIDHLVNDVRLYGYYGGIRLLKAAIKRFYDYCTDNRIELIKRNFTIRYCSDIPHQVGLAGSSAIITACMRALISFYQVDIPNAALANLILSVENQELKIPAGLQDRVAQVYQGLVYMDFNREMMTRQGYGVYQSLDPLRLPPLYIAYQEDLSEGSEVFHNNIRERYDRDEPDVMNAMTYWGDLTDQVKGLIEQHQEDGISVLLNRNFDMRRTIYRISEQNIRMVEIARAAGASAKFSGSGGAIVGVVQDDAMFEKLQRDFESLHVKVIRPRIV